MPPKNDFLTLHVALATYPKGQSLAYVENIRNYYKSFKQKTKEHYQNRVNNPTKSGQPEILEEDDKTYEPLVYHIFGSFDVAFISLIDNYKFAQKIFFPESDGSKSTKHVDTNSYQVMTGILPEEQIKTLRLDFQELNQKTFICICNLKLTNGFLVGNGQDYVDAVFKLIAKDLDNREDVKYIVLQSFSWFEIALMIFTDEVKHIANIVGSIRDSQVKDLEGSDKIIKNSLYAKYPGKSVKRSELIHFNIFADTQSYIGVSFDKFSNPHENFAEFDLKTQIEWQVKPGQLQNLLNRLGELNIFRNSIDGHETLAITGKSDYLIAQEKDSLVNNFKLFHKFLDEEKSGTADTLRAFMRSYKTKPLIPYKYVKKTRTENPPRIRNPFKDQLYFKSTDIKKTYGHLKALKVSRHIRQKINKIFFNYNTGIQDPILNIYFNDFYDFLKHLQVIIQEEFAQTEKAFSYTDQKGFQSVKTVEDIESILEKFITAFEEGYHARTLNCYQFEEIYDFDLDINSSIQQLLTTYNTVVKDIADSIILRSGHRHPQIVQLNLRNTTSNKISINYNVYHLTNPEFIFFTIVKEILNGVAKDKDLYLSKYFNKISEILIESDDPYIRDLAEDGGILPQYYAIDPVQLLFICNDDIQLYQYWFWMYNFQNSSLYLTRGIFAEIHFKKELFRLVFLVALKSPELIDSLECPISEISSYWHRYFALTKRSILKLLRENPDLGTGIFSELSLRLDLSPADSEELYKFYDLYKHAPERIYYSEDSKNYAPRNNVIFLRWIMYSYLRLIYEENGKQVAVLRRDWENGSPMKSFIENNKEQKQLFLVDPLGGLFFTNADKEKRYYAIQSKMLQTLWHYSSVSKKYFLANISRH